jgi:hypothetical protein
VLWQSWLIILREVKSLNDTSEGDIQAHGLGVPKKGAGFRKENSELFRRQGLCLLVIAKGG